MVQRRKACDQRQQVPAVARPEAPDHHAGADGGRRRLQLHGGESGEQRDERARQADRLQ